MSLFNSNGSTPGSLIDTVSVNVSTGDGPETISLTGWTAAILEDQEYWLVGTMEGYSSTGYWQTSTLGGTRAFRYNEGDWVYGYSSSVDGTQEVGTATITVSPANTDSSTLYATDNADTFWIGLATGDVTIEDFLIGEDEIDLSAYGFTSTDDFTIESNGDGGSLVMLSETASINILGVSDTALEDSPESFVLV